MARIPAAEEVNRVIGDGVAPIATVDTRNVGGGLDRLAAVVDQRLDARTRYQYSQAASEFLVNKTKQDTAYDNDQDYRTIEKRYTEGVGTALDRAANMIEDNTVRNEFLAQYRVDAAQGTARIRDVAFSKERDYQRGYINQQLESVSNAAMTGDVEVALNTGQAMLRSAVDMGYVSAEEYSERTSNFRQNVKVRSLEMMKPQERLSALESPFGSDLPADVRAKLVNATKVELVDDEAIGHVDEAMTRLRAGTSPTEIVAGFSKIKDLAVREAASDKFNQEFARTRVAEADEAASIVSKYVVALRKGGMEFNQIPEADLERIAALDYRALESLQAAERSKAPTPAERELFEQKKRYAYVAIAATARNVQVGGPPRNEFVTDAQGQRVQFPNAAAEYKATLAQLGAYLDTEDFERFTEIDINGTIPEPTKRWLTDLQMFENVINQATSKATNDRQKQDIVGAERQAMNAWRTSLGHEPTIDETQEYLDKMVIRRHKVLVDKPGIGTGDYRWSELTPEQKDAELAKLAETSAMKAVVGRVGTGVSADRLRAEYELEKQRGE